VLKAIPRDQAVYKPDPKARSAAELGCGSIAAEEQALETLLDTGIGQTGRTSPAPCPARGRQ
jgi:hypothetical protein